MTEPGSGSAGRRRWSARWLWLVPAVILAWLVLTASGRAAWGGFFASLRIARPKAVSVSFPTFSGPRGTHRLQDAVAAMVADNVQTKRQEADTTVADPAAASRLAGFAIELPAARSDTARLSVEGARAISMTVVRSRLQSILGEAGLSRTRVPASVNGATLAISTPAGVLARYGTCPARARGTLTDQIAQRPPPSTDYGDCIELTQRPVVSARVPAGLDMRQLERIALEVAGMSPAQSADFQRVLGWQSALTLRMPRFIRSYKVIRVGGSPAMLLNTAGRRQPTYVLIWAASGRVYTLAGYGSASDALPLARSLR